MAEVETTREGGVLTITLNRPDVLNALNRALHAALAAALTEARAADVRAVVVTGAGRGARRRVRRSAHARHRPDEATVRPRRHGDAGGAAGVRSPAPGGGGADGRFPRGRGRLPREAEAGLQGALALRADREPEPAC